MTEKAYWVCTYNNQDTANGRLNSGRTCIWFDSLWWWIDDFEITHDLSGQGRPNKDHVFTANLRQIDHGEYEFLHTEARARKALGEQP